MNKSAKSNGAVVELTYHGGSMRSLFRSGEQIRVRKCLTSDILPGDVIVYQHPKQERYVVHRVIGVHAGGFLTRGDDMIAADSDMVLPDQLIGKVDAIQRSGKWKPIATGLPGLIRARTWHFIRGTHYALLHRSISFLKRKSGPLSADLVLLPRTLLTLLTASLKGTLREEIDSLPEDTWPKLFALASRQDLILFLYNRLQKSGGLELLPVETVDRLQEMHQKSWISMQRLLHAHHKIINALDARNIDCISLKGLWYAQELYTDPTTRPMVDLDFLVRPKQLQEALQVFGELGYVSIQEHDSVSLEKEIWLYHPERRIKVDLHQDLVPYYADFNWDVCECWDRAVEAKLGEQKIRVLCPEDQLLHVVLHSSFEHMFQPLKVLLDTYLAFKKWGSDIDLNRFRMRAEEVGLGRALDLQTAVLERAFNDESLPIPVCTRSVPTDGVRWLMQTAPVMHPLSLLHMYAARDYLFYIVKRMRSVMGKKRRPASQSGAKTRSLLTDMSVGSFLRRSFIFSGLVAGFIYSSIRHPDRRQFTFLRLLSWLVQN